MSKQVLVLSTKNDSVSIIAEAILTRYLPEFTISSAGTKPSQNVNKEIKQALIKDGVWSDKLTPKHIDRVMNSDYDMVIILSDEAAQKCPDFTEETVIIQIDYDESEYSNNFKLERLIKTIKMELIPITRNQFS